MLTRRPAINPSVVCALLASASLAAAATPFEIIVLGDPQNYNDHAYTSGRNQLTRQGEWIADNVGNENIAFVTAVGDNVNYGGTLTLQRNASNAYGPLAGAVPHSLVFGNHDFYSDASAANSRQFYGASRFQDVNGNNLPWYGGTADPAGAYASVNNMVSYQTFSAGGYDFLHINLPMLSNAGSANAITVAQKADALAWAHSVAAAHPTMPTILSTHELLETTGPDAINGEVMTGLLKDNPQIFMTISGHNHGQLDQILQVADSSGTHNVLQVLVDYQDVSDGGGNNGAGYLRKVIFDQDNSKISFQTYSPSQNVFMPNNTALTNMGPDRSNFSYTVNYQDDLIIVPTAPARTVDATPALRTSASHKGRYTQSFNGFARTSAPNPPEGWTVWNLAPYTQGSANFNATTNPITAANVGGGTLLTTTLGLYDGGAPATNANALNSGTSNSDYDRSLGTCTTNVAAKVLQLNLVNDSGAPITSLAVGYERREPATSHPSEELPGYSVFYSTDGGTTWNATTLSTTRQAQANPVASLGSTQVARGVMRFNSPIVAGSSLLLRWADDNAVASPDASYAIDNFSAITGAPLTSSGYSQNFNSLGRAGASLPAGWSIWNIKGAAGDITNATPNATLASSYLPSAVAAQSQTVEVVSAGYAQNAGALNNASYRGSNSAAGYSFDVAANVQIGNALDGNRAVATSVGLVAAKVIELAITNPSAAPIAEFTFSFDLLQPYVAPAGEASSLLGYRLFFSRDGASWNPFQLYKDGGTTLLNPESVGNYSAQFDFSANPLLANDMLLFRWLDDNQSVNGGGDEHSWAIDNVSLTVVPVPEPASLALLASGLAALTLHSRKRRGMDFRKAIKRNT